LWLPRHSALAAHVIELQSVVMEIARMRLLFRSIWLACIALLAGALVSGCGTTVAEDAPLARGALQASKSRLTIYRPANLVAAAGGARVKIDGREVANIGAGDSTQLDVPAGSHKVAVYAWGHPNEYAITLDARPGMLYTLEISPRPEAAVAGVAFGLVGMLAEAAANQNGGTFEIRVVEAKPTKS
jgi:uncharacterized Zn-binding protein involved in type VI secretion